MKHEFILADVIVPRPNMANLIFELRIWESTVADSTISSADYSVSFNQESKIHVEGKTTAELLARIREEVISKAQGYINNYQTKVMIQNKQAVLELITDIDGTLTS